jgi:hypothetical protein
MWKRALLAIALLVLLYACRRTDPDLAACIPTGTVAVAGIDLAQAKSSPALARLRERVPGLDSASHAIAAWDGAELLVAVSGNFAAPPAGATMASPSVALFGAEAKVRTALAQYRTGTPGAPQLLAQAPRDRAVWAAIRGDATLPLRGNAANFNRLLHSTEYTSLGLTLAGAIRLDASGVCRSAADADRLRATAGGMLLLSGISNASVEVKDREVRLSVTLPESAAASLLGSFLR